MRPWVRLAGCTSERRLLSTSRRLPKSMTPLMHDEIGRAYTSQRRNMSSIDDQIARLVSANKTCSPKPSPTTTGLMDPGVLSESQDDARSEEDGAREPQSSDSAHHAAHPQSAEVNVTVRDKFGMVVKSAIGMKTSGINELCTLLPERLQDSLRLHCRRFSISALHPMQQALIPLILERRDAVCVAPTASGKTLGYLVPCIANLVATQEMITSEGDDSLSADNIAKLTQTKLKAGHMCKYCEMDVFSNPVCSLTGHPHRIPDESPEELLTRKSLAAEYAVGQPKLLILVPTAILGQQIHEVAMSLRCGLKVHALVRPDSHEEELKQQSRAKSADILIATPERLVMYLYKHIVSLEKVETIVMDEVDKLLSNDFFEQIKIVLGSFSRRSEGRRPQKILISATLPQAMHEMIRTRLLQPSHRFVLASRKSERDIRRVNAAANINHTPATASPPAAGVVPSSSATHIIFMVGRGEKVDKLVSLFTSGTIQSDQRTIIFCTRKSNANHVADHLDRRLRSCDATASARVIRFADNTTHCRRSVMQLFQSGVATVLVATDLIGRGIDFHNVVNVIHYDLPPDMDTFVHRSGRCGRHGTKGYVYSLFQPENVALSKPLVAFLKERSQLVPPKLVQYANQSFVDLFKSSLHHTRPAGGHRNPERHTPVVGGTAGRTPDYRQDANNKNFRLR